MGHLKEMNDEQRSSFLSHKYARAKEERKGNSFEWYNHEKHEKLINEKGYSWVVFKNHFNKDSLTTHQIEAEEKVKELRDSNHYARIVCGMEQCMQRIKSFSVIYKPKKY